MKTRTKRTLCLLTALAVTASATVFTGCKSTNSNGQGTSQGTQTMSAEQVKKTLAFKTDKVSIPSGKDPNGRVAYKNGLYYAVTSAYKALPADEENEYGGYESSTFMTIFDETGNVKTEIPLLKTNSSDNSYGTAGDFTVDGSGNITVSISITKYDPVTYDGVSTSSIKTFDASGNEISSFSTDEFFSDEQNGYISSWLTDNDGNIFLLGSTKVVVLDKSGNKLFEIKAVNNDNAWLGSLVLTNGGQVGYTLNEYNQEKSTTTLNIIDLSAKSTGKTYDISGINYSSEVFNGSGDYLFYTRGDTGILGVKPDLSTDSVLNLLTLGIDTTDMGGFYVCEDGSFLMTSYGYGAEDSSITKLYPVDASEIKEKTIINLGCFYTDWSVRSLIADFNKTNENYTIVVNSYTDSNDTSDYDAAQTAFNNQLLAGNVPDILLVDESMPYESYASKGLFTDLYTLIDSDPSMTRDDFLPNVLTALQTKDKLYTITPSFSVSTFVTKSGHLGGKQFLTLADAKNEIASMTDGSMMDYSATREEYVTQAIAYSDFIDYDNAKCDFDNDAFKAIIEYSKNYPENIDYDALYNEDPGYYEKHTRDFLDDKTLVQSLYLGAFREMDYQRAQLGSDYVFTNIPTDRPATIGLIETSVRMSISSNSAQKDGSWEFIKYCLDHTLQENHKGYYNADDKYITTDDIEYTTKAGNMPILKKQYDILLAHALDPNFYYDYNGNKVEDDRITYIGSEEVKLPPMTQEELDKIDQMFRTPTKKLTVNNELMTIIKDEISSYYAGNKSVDETVQLIQSRANIYMSEHY